MRERPTGIPDSPGSYQFKDPHGRVIYVGKASSLRSRLSSYFQDPSLLHPRTAQMVAEAESVEWITVRNELEALMLEYTLIKEHRPRYNIRLRDDKSYPFLAVTVDEEWPRAFVMRGTRRKGTRYFGPFAHAYAIRDTLDLLLRTFPIRTCSDGKFEQHRRLGRPCLLYHIEKCSGPCVGGVETDSYVSLVRDLCKFLDGDTDGVVSELREQMERASQALEFERAARLRDRLQSVERAVEKQQMVAERDEDFDAIAVVDDDLEAAVQVFYVRRGRVVGRKGLVIDKVEDLTPSGLGHRIVELLYGDEPVLGTPPALLVETEPDRVEVLEEWLSNRRGTKVSVRVPKRGDKRTLLETARMNAKEEFTRHRIKRASDHNSRSRALTEIQDALALPDAPLRIECYDMAHLHGTDYVGSMVVMEDGLPAKREYRRFKIKTVDGNDDYAAMREVLTRRLSAYLSERDEMLGDEGSGPRRFAYPPQLLLVDGGRGQLSVAVDVVKRLGLDSEIPVAALAKKFEEVFVPDRDVPIVFARGSEGLFMLQRIRDEAHRFANTFHRELRSKRMTSGSLSGIPGLGEARQKRLVKTFGGVNAVKAASLEDLLAVSWLPSAVAHAVHEKFHGPENVVQEK
ncbi:MAG: excinuclease ABC subunit UvrC [Actinomycetota bacterium]|nr:excinuclease ABC subunit UvrC [Actinomycetota bacterium]MDA2971274.1 excinuclease ABC subunit UvrC [Actinomycetota bacterium]MDA3001046.1 excinuclease ABC subunit UvrC [Actinomycetota bacterium]